jgi:hypothetical protein
LTAEIAEDFAKFVEKIFLRVLVETPAPPAFCRNALERKQPPGWSRLFVFFPQQLLALGS